ncbi:hypothetical protein ACFRAQ_28800 [Nocardia sp. NPDC056611]|uniref:hypothetical protein n=1 Tax=Nocardia sp. NPDC056611 TaxID=3345877 RepID=UPI00366B172D
MQELLTSEQVEQYLRQAHIISEYQQLGMRRMEHAWVCWRILTPDEANQAARTPGTGVCLIVNPITGVVISHGSSMHPLTWGEMYDQSIRTGEPMPAGGQIYPHRWRLNIQRAREDQTEIEYLVTAESLTEPPEPSTELRLIVNRESQQIQTTGNTNPELISRATNAVQGANRQTETWPGYLTIEY